MERAVVAFLAQFRRALQDPLLSREEGRAVPIRVICREGYVGSSR